MSILFIYLSSAFICILLLLILSMYDYNDGIYLTLQDVILSIVVGIIPIMNLIAAVIMFAHTGRKIIVWKFKEGK